MPGDGSRCFARPVRVALLARARVPVADRPVVHAVVRGVVVGIGPWAAAPGRSLRLPTRRRGGDESLALRGSLLYNAKRLTERRALHVTPSASPQPDR